MKEVSYNKHLLNKLETKLLVLVNPKALDRSEIKGNDAYSMELFELFLLDLVVMNKQPVTYLRSEVFLVT